MSAQYTPPFIIVSHEPTIACFGSCPSLKEARDYISQLQRDFGLCLKGTINCYHKMDYVLVESFDIREDFYDVAS